MRPDGRKYNQLRPITLTTGYMDFPEGSVLIAMGATRVICNVTIEEGVPNWMRDQKVPGGWVTAEYAMLPRATHRRTQREIFRMSGRTQEIRRLIGRSLRAAVDLQNLGPRTFIVDCDVLQADGGTRTAAITGGFVALRIALNKLISVGELPVGLLKTSVAAVSVGVVDGFPLLDLCYDEDSTAEVDINVVMTSQGEYIEVQGTAERAPFTRQRLDELLDLAYLGIGQLITIQSETLGPPGYISR